MKEIPIRPEAEEIISSLIQGNRGVIEHELKMAYLLGVSEGIQQMKGLEK